MPRIIHVVGARPNFMKAAPVILALRDMDGVQQRIVHTGQHYDANMSEVFFRQLGLPEPDLNLEVGSGSHAAQTAQIMTRFEEVVLCERPDWVVVYGDVNSTVAATLVSAKLGIRIAHVEAGLRSFDQAMPEEINRIVTDRLADLLLTPSEDGNENLAHEGVPSERVVMVGNCMIDSPGLLADTAVKLLMVTRRHNSHARYVVGGLLAGRRVFVEKPLCLTFEGWEEIRTAHVAAAGPFLMVGFNRRSAPHVARARQLLGTVPGPKTFLMTVNAGALPPAHRTQDPAVGGGRIVGEACHFIELLRFLPGGPVAGATATYATGRAGGCGTPPRCNWSMPMARRDCPLPGQRREVVPRGAARSVLPRPRPPVRQLPRPARLRLAGLPAPHAVVAGQGSRGRDAGGGGRRPPQGGPSPISLEELREVAVVSLRLAAGVVYRGTSREVPSQRSPVPFLAPGSDNRGRSLVSTPHHHVT
ncbi:MAG: UDP-N-acetylglucosamine 2-epimerase [Verrucomicrobiales bacterium]|nr:UDP-N-acetylglucosamine 2-epimerase [Verrucomicrobiales bacterium]